MKRRNWRQSILFVSRILCTFSRNRFREAATGNTRSPMAQTSSRDPIADRRSSGTPRAFGRVAPRRADGDDRVYRAIHEAILDHRLPPGTRLAEIALAGLFGATRTVVRKALARLEHERLVELRANRGAVVASPSIDESRHLFGARRAIECAIVRALSRSITRAQARELRALVREEVSAYRRGEMRHGLKLSIAFHRKIAAMAGNTVLCEFLDQLVARTPLVLLAYRGPQGHAACTDDEHSAIAEAIAAGEGDRASRLMSAHLDAIASQLRLADEDPATNLATIFAGKRIR